VRNGVYLTEREREKKRKNKRERERYSIRKRMKYEIEREIEREIVRERESIPQIHSGSRSRESGLIDCIPCSQFNCKSVIMQTAPTVYSVG